MKICPKCSAVDGTPHERHCPMEPKVVPAIAMDVLNEIGKMLPDVELEGYAAGMDRWLAVQNHVADLVRRNAQLDRRNVELERRLLDVVAATKGIRSETIPPPPSED